jgi:peptidoglycan/LPS O-acetylase OafA/YrhL
MRGSGSLTAADRLASRLTRRTSGGRWIPEIDGLRFVAIMLVIAAHVAATVGLATHRSVVVALPFGDTSMPQQRDVATELFRQGFIGVEIFFMVSGFVLALPFISHRHAGGKPVDIGSYFRRRITRIEPPYLFVMTLLFVGSWLAGVHIAIGHLAASGVYLHGLLFGGLTPVNGVAWSLEVEVQFYVLVPALALLLCAGRRLTRRPTILLLAGTAIVVQVLGVIPPRHQYVDASLASFAQFFLVGWLLADIYVTDWQGSPTTQRRWDVVALIVFPSLLTGLARIGMFEQTIAPWIVFTLGYCAFRGPTMRRLLSNRWIALVGGMCYSIYLIHYPMFIVMQHALAPVARFPAPVALLIAFVLLVPMAVIGGALLFVALERPCMDPLWFDRLVARLKRSRVGWPRSRARHVERPSGAPSVDQEPIPAGYVMNGAES